MSFTITCDHCGCTGVQIKDPFSNSIIIQCTNSSCGNAMELLNSPLVLIHLEETCGGCPMIWKGRTKEGKTFEANYRWGSLTAWVDDEVIFSKTIGGEYDGVMSQEEMLRQVGAFLSYSY